MAKERIQENGVEEIEGWEVVEERVLPPGSSSGDSADLFRDVHEEMLSTAVGLFFCVASSCIHCSGKAT